MLMKQTAAAFALIPIVHTLISKRTFSDFASSLVPAASIVVALAAVRLFCPQLFSAMVIVPAAIKVYYQRAWEITLYLLATFPIFVIALLAVFKSGNRIDERERWILSAIIVLVPVSIWTICKSGGSYNSLLFAYLAMTALFVARLDLILAWISSLPAGRSFWAATGLAIAILCSFFIQFDRAMALLSARCGDDKYESAVVLARRLGPGAISPQDPTVAFRATGYFGRALLFELDAHAVNGNWPGQLPDSMREELTHSSYVVEVKSYVPTPVFARGLAANGFHVLPVRELDGSAYTVWAKSDGETK
jgi:hypothetical protein